MKKIIKEVKTLISFFRWYKNYVKNGKKLTVAFCGFRQEYEQAVHDNPHMNFIFVNHNRVSDTIGRKFDTYIRFYGNPVNENVLTQLKTRSKL